MNKQVTINLSETVLNQINQINSPENINIFIEKAINYYLDEVNKNHVQKRPPLFGSDKDLITIADDFDEPLEDFKDYM